MNGSSVIHTSKLCHSYGQQAVLRDVTINVSAVSFFVVIGPNGSGKTTLMKILAGVMPLQSGEISIGNRPVGKYTKRELSRTVAYVPQLVASDVPFSVMDLVLMGRTPYHGMLGFESHDDIAIAKEALEITDVSHLARRRLDQLSGGEQQRVMIARAVCQQAPIIMLDEPTASLDLSHQIRIMDLMNQLRSEKGVTVVMISHDINLAAMYAEQLLLLNQGRVSRIGSPAEVLTQELLEDVYQCGIMIDVSPVGPYPRITPLPGHSLT